jgi:cobalt-precorrin 5A hydrolase
MEVKSIMASKKINLMGSEVVEGFKCKPKKLNPNKPIMFYKAIVYICSDKRCAKVGSFEKARELREIVKEMGLEKGKNRIKISRSFCQGTCRFRQVAQINSISPNDKLWLKHTHKFEKKDWIELFEALRDDKEFKKNKIDMKLYE